MGRRGDGIRYLYNNPFFICTGVGAAAAELDTIKSGSSSSSRELI